MMRVYHMMIRVAAMLAFVALIAMHTDMARARPPAAAPMAHMPAMPMAPCADRAHMVCDLCCVVAPVAGNPLPVRARVPALFIAVPATPQTGFAVPPALPPPRFADHAA